MKTLRRKMKFAKAIGALSVVAVLAVGMFAGQAQATLVAEYTFDTDLSSPSAVRGLLAGVGPDLATVVEQAVVATVGPVTSEAARTLGVRVDVEATESTSRGLVEALRTYEGWARSPSPTAL